SNQRNEHPRQGPTPSVISARGRNVIKAMRKMLLPVSLAFVAFDMRIYLILATSLLLVGCGREEANQPQGAGKLEALNGDLANKRADTVRWAFANKREIDMAVFHWSRDKMEAAKKTEALSPEIEEKIRQYEALQAQLMHKQMDAMRAR